MRVLGRAPGGVALGFQYLLGAVERQQGGVGGPGRVGQGQGHGPGGVAQGLGPAVVELRQVGQAVEEAPLGRREPVVVAQSADDCAGAGELLAGAALPVQVEPGQAGGGGGQRAVGR